MTNYCSLIEGLIEGSVDDGKRSELSEAEERSLSFNFAAARQRASQRGIVARLKFYIISRGEVWRGE